LWRINQLLSGGEHTLLKFSFAILINKPYAEEKREREKREFNNFIVAARGLEKL
jgi:hypothetical protein